MALSVAMGLKPIATDKADAIGFIG